MALRWLVRPNSYYDSVKLMRVSETLAALPGVARAAAVMGTPLNLRLLADDGLLDATVQATTDDLLISVVGDDEAVADAALARAEELLRARPPEERLPTAPLRAIEQAVGQAGSNFAVIAVPGPSAAVEAFAALRAGMHVFLFSDNVSLRDEARLKRLASERGLLMMGPDCGTSIVDGVGLGFANRVRPGPVGIVGASGTGIQHVSCLLDLAGIGIAQALGTGGRDLSGAVRGSMTRRAIAMLAADDEVELIAVVTKPASDSAMRLLHRELIRAGKPVIACLLGEMPPSEGAVSYVTTITDAAQMVVERLGGDSSQWFGPATVPADRIGRANSGPVLGFFAGGTLCSEAGQVLDRMGVPHRLLDLGGDEYTRGRAHPMIDGRLRASMVTELADRPRAAALLLDVVLGDLAHPDPAGALAPAIAALPAGLSAYVTLV
ncbi:MAG TPA: hypothetical protein VKX16_03775, partial [Chloroflexota bacterium]|nr:hypothetical protein [Chloroflexota bacterium]